MAMRGTAESSTAAKGTGGGEKKFKKNRLDLGGGVLEEE
jgi:hypothetical protein